MRIAVVALALGLSQPCYAQMNNAESGAPSSGARAGENGWTLTLGAAPVLSPAWQGSKDMVLSVYPDLRINYGDAIFASVPDGVGWNALNRAGWKAGPLAKFRFGRGESNGGSPFVVTGGSDALLGMGDVSAAAEVGGFIEKRWGVAGNWSVRTEVRRGFGGHEGVLADGSISYQVRLGRTIMSVGPRATAASAGFMQTYFGIDVGQSQRTGLAQYRPNAGLLSYGIGGTLVRPLDQRSVVTLFFGLDRLGNQAERSPLVRERGQSTQFSVGVGYGFRFNL
jgi:outer membrane protein